MYDMACTVFAPPGQLWPAVVSRHKKFNYEQFAPIDSLAADTGWWGPAVSVINSVD